MTTDPTAHSTGCPLDSLTHHAESNLPRSTPSAGPGANGPSPG
jgi:hypothetical protein